MKTGFLTGFLLTTSPEHQDGDTVFRLAEAFLDEGESVEIYLMEDGLYHGVRNASPKKLGPDFAPLLKRGVPISVCSFNLEIRGIAEESLIEGVQLRSQYDLSHLVGECDRFLTF
ncbi:MAG: DsrE family protein [Nitrospirae bacterium]|nr:DsrE family protein [Nitrospirota bacterium]